MNTDKQALLMMQGVIYNLPEEERRKVEACADKLRAVVKKATPLAPSPWLS